MGRDIVLRKEEVRDSKGNLIATVTYTVNSDMIPVLLSIADADIGVKDIEHAAKDPRNIPPDRAGKRAKLKKMGYTDADLDVLEKEGVI